MKLHSSTKNYKVNKYKTYNRVHNTKRKYTKKKEKPRLIGLVEITHLLPKSSR